MHGCLCAVQMCVRPEPRLRLTSKAPALVNLILINYHHDEGHSCSSRLVWNHLIIKAFCNVITRLREIADASFAGAFSAVWGKELPLSRACFKHQTL